MYKAFIPISIIIITTFSHAMDMDHQFWGGYGFQHEFNDSWKLQSDGENRFRNDASEQNFKKISIELSYAFKPWLDIGVTYQRGSIKGSEWVPEQKPVLRLNFKYERGPWEISNQHKFEYRDRKDNYNIRVYKNRTQVATDYYIKGKEFSFYLNDEIFYNATDHYANINRIRFGTKFYITNYLKPDIGVVFQSSNHHTFWDYQASFAIKLWIVL